MVAVVSTAANYWHFKVVYLSYQENATSHLLWQKMDLPKRSLWCLVVDKSLSAVVTFAAFNMVAIIVITTTTIVLSILTVIKMMMRTQVSTTVVHAHLDQTINAHYVQMGGVNDNHYCYCPTVKP